MKKYSWIAFVFLLGLSGCKKEQKCIDTKKYLDFGVQQVKEGLALLKDTAMMPRTIKPGEKGWSTTSIYSWTSGFWPGLLWYVYEYTGDDEWKTIAAKWTNRLEPVKHAPHKDHDLGFMMYNSFGNGLRLTHNKSYIKVLVETADSLASLYNPNVGTIVSWPYRREKNWAHNTIIDNMMNLELLFWASKATGNKNYYNIAVKHAETTMKNHIRPDSTTFHVILYDSITGDVIKGVTAQGANDSSMWARGQAWGIYGFTMCYRETHRLDFLETAEKLAHKFVEELPPDFIPYWDFNAPNIPNEEKDASAAAIAASGMLELSRLIVNPAEKKFMRTSADNILRALINNNLSDGSNVAILEHSVGNKPGNSEVDVPLIYADYYFFEALLRERQIQRADPESCN